VVGSWNALRLFVVSTIGTPPIAVTARRTRFFDR
jgi:hypothetical protein